MNAKQLRLEGMKVNDAAMGWFMKRLKEEEAKTNPDPRMVKGLKKNMQKAVDFRNDLLAKIEKM